MRYTGKVNVAWTRDSLIDIKEWIGHGYINKIEGSLPELGREKD